jgi:hypothetical protein
MANDREVLREIWEGRLPVCFQLNSEEVHSLQAPDAYYLMVPRLSYFPLVTDKVRRKTHQRPEIHSVGTPILLYLYKNRLYAVSALPLPKFSRDKLLKWHSPPLNIINI